MTIDSIKEKKTARKKLKLTVPDMDIVEKGKMKSNRLVAAQTKQEKKQMKNNKNKEHLAKIKLKKIEKRKSPKSKVSDISGVRCPACDEVGGAEEWVKCGKCKTWWHEACSAYEGCGIFVCDFC